jgi:hypothetical protein
VIRGYVVIVFYELQVELCQNTSCDTHTLNTFEQGNVNSEVGVFFLLFL